MRGNHVLMHGKDKVAECKFDKNCYLEKITKIENEKLLLIGILNDDAQITKINLQRWILSRNLAMNRKDIAPLREFYGSQLFISSMGLSLFDTYWFACDECSDWDECNPFDNWTQQNDMVYLMLTNPSEIRIFDLTSPNLTIPGKEPRLWFRNEDNKLMLLYGEAQKEMTEYKLSNENPVVAKRKYRIQDKKIYVEVNAETNKSIERISFDDLYNTCQNPEKSKIVNLKNTCEYFHIPNWKSFINYMCEYDEAIDNQLRELNDVGVLRDTKTLEIIGFSKL